MGAACRHGGQTVGRSAASSGSQQDGQPSASAASRAGAGDTKRAGPRRDTMPRRPAGAAQRNHRRQSGQPSTSPTGQQAAGDTNARAREDTTTRRPARNSKRARARYWRRGGRPLRVRKPKIFLGKGSKNRFRGTGAGKVGGVKNATEEENGAVLGKKEAAYAAACGENGGAVEVGGCIWNGRALACA